MTSTGPGDDAAPIDPDFAGLFRPEDLAPPAPPAVVAPTAEPEPQSQAQPADPIPGDQQPGVSVDEEPVAAPVGAAPIAEPSVDTGRLFRSQGVVGHEQAVLALSSDHFGRLRTLERRRDGEPAAAPVAPLAVATEDEAPALAGAVADPEAADDALPLPPVAAAAADVSEGRSRRRSVRGITGGAVYLIVIGVTVLVAFANALLADGDLGWPTGLALLVSSVYAALTVRREDDTVAMIVPPIAFLVASLTAGQLFLGSAEGSLVNRAVVVFFNLADNWVWIIGATVVALVIVLVRRRRG